MLDLIDKPAEENPREKNMSPKSSSVLKQNLNPHVKCKHGAYILSRKIYKQLKINAP